MRPVSWILILLALGGVVHAHEAEHDDPCPQCTASEQGLLDAAVSPEPVLVVQAFATCSDAAAPTTARRDGLSARAPPKL